jgi:16S rRNA (uracil1498-N3)-methyltransferase
MSKAVRDLDRYPEMADRFYIPPSQWDATALVLSEHEARHCTQVMRHREGDEIIVFNGRGEIARARISAAGKNEVRLECLELQIQPEALCRITLAAALIKAERWEWLVEKATELGASEIQPIITERCVVRLGADEVAKKLEKWNRLMIETCKQCGRAWAPQLHLPRKLDSVLSGAKRHDLSLIASLAGSARSIPQVLAGYTSAAPHVLILIGPEGDFSPAEYDMAAHSGLVPVTLGSQVLRAETAALSALSILGQLLHTAPCESV